MSPCFGHQLPQSPFLLSIKHSGLNYNQESSQSCWSIMKGQQSQRPRQSKSPLGKRSQSNEQHEFHCQKKNDFGTFDSHCDTMIFKTPMAYDNMGVGQGVQPNDFRSCKLLNFDDAYEEDQESLPNGIHLKDVLGSSNLHFFTSPHSQVSLQKSQAKNFQDFSTMKSPFANHFTPYHDYVQSKNERLQNSCSTTTSEQISEEDMTLMTPLIGRVQSQSKKHC